jgi:hypothetical protein
LRLIDIAKYLKDREGQKYVFIFYQREFLPQIDNKIWAQASIVSQDVDGANLNHLLADVMNYYNQDISVDVNRIRQAYADASTSVHFLFITKPTDHMAGVSFVERSNDVFTPLFEMAKASGGFAESSANPDYLFKKAVEASENYYLLYYTPKNYSGDGKFKTIKVRVKGKGFKVVHRLGYFSN